jgi:hypothetical protein
VTVTATVGPSVLGPITASATVTGQEPDPAAANNTDSEVTTVILAADSELVHGSSVRADLQALPGPVADEDRYRIGQKPHASYEVVLDEGSADVGAGNGPSLDRMGADGSTVVQASLPAGTGPSRSLRWENAGSSAVDDQTVRVRSQSCTTDCGADDVYRLRAYETTSSAPRFNNSATQVTFLLLQNASDTAMSGHVFFWSPTGALLETIPFGIPAHGLFALNAAALPTLAGQSGSVTVTHDGRYGDLAGKAVSLEPATGFAFDTPLLPRPR